MEEQEYTPTVFFLGVDFVEDLILVKIENMIFATGTHPLIV